MYFVGSGGATILTSQRLLLNYEGWYNIPLHTLKKYTLADGPLDIVWEQDGTQQSLSLSGTFLLESTVNGRMNACASETHRDGQTRLPGMSRADLETAGIQIERLEFLDPDEPIPS